MTKTEQKKFIKEAIEAVTEGGFTLGYFLKQINISRTHFYFIRKGERPLTDDKERSIIGFMEQKSLYSETN